MALIQCVECGNKVSTQAVSCPGCGAVIAAFPPRPTKVTNPWMVIGWIVLAMLVLPLATCALLLGVATSNRVSDGVDRANAALPAPAEKVTVPASTWLRWYNAAMKAGSYETAFQYAERLRSVHPNSPERAQVDADAGNLEALKKLGGKHE